MRTAYKAWAGTFAGVFLLVAACDVATGDTPSSSTSSRVASAAPPFARTGTVDRFANPANLHLADGRSIHVPMLNGSDITNPTDACRERAADDTVRAMLGGKSVTLTAPPRTRDAASLVPAGYVEADVAVDGVDYAAAFERRYAEAAFDRCTPAVVAPVEPAPASASSGSDVYVDSDDDTNHRDGAATGGYCRRKWWC